MKGAKGQFFLVFLLCLDPMSSSVAQEQELAGEDPAQALQNNEGGSVDTEAPARVTRSLPNAEKKRIEALKAQYPPEDLQHLTSAGEKFTALWRKDRSGKAFGALLIVPTDGQTANWPHTIDVLRTELPKAGWSTLSIDVKPLAAPKAPARPEPISDMEIDSNEDVEPASGDEDDQNLEAESASMSEMGAAGRGESKRDIDQPSKSGIDANMDRIKAAVTFLHEQGQYNIVVAGYGASAKRVLDYAQDATSPGMKKSVKTNVGSNMQRPIRAMVIVNPQSPAGLPIGSTFETFAFKDMPILDLIVGTHYLDELDADKRKSVARSVGFETYVQIQMLEPSSVVFGQENRLSRRVRGFLHKYAKGVEIGK